MEEVKLFIATQYVHLCIKSCSLQKKMQKSHKTDKQNWLIQDQQKINLYFYIIAMTTINWNKNITIIILINLVTLSNKFDKVHARTIH